MTIIASKSAAAAHVDALRDRYSTVDRRISEINSGDGLTATMIGEEKALKSELSALRNLLESMGSTQSAGGRWSNPPVSGPAGGQALPTESPATIHRTGGKSAAEMWGDTATDSAGFADFDDYMNAITIGDSARLAAVSGHNEGVPSQGGYGVPQTFEYQLFDRSYTSELVRQFCRVIGMTTLKHTISQYDDFDRSGGEYFGGLKGVWVAEGDQLAMKTQKGRQTVLQAKTFGFMSSATIQLASDDSTFESGLTQHMAMTVGGGLDSAALFGTGAGQPLGILNAPSTIVVAKETGQAASTILYDNLTAMFSRLHPSCIPTARWVFNSSCIPQLLKLSVSVGTGGTVVPALVKGATGYELFTLPCHFTDKMRVLGTEGDVLLCDFSKYALGLVKGGMRIDRSDHLKFDTGEIVWRVLLRADGVPLWSSAYTPENGSSLSWAVTLATRA